jgi:NOL1/NOP2/fmu family ribosome biogenesis protein
MPALEPLNTRAVKKISQISEAQWETSLTKDYVYLTNKKNKLYIVNKECFDVDFTKLRIDSIGVYFGELFEDQLRLSIEGSQILGPLAKKNIIDLSYEEMRTWLKGNELENKFDCTGFVIIKHNNDYCGCGKVVGNTIKNYVSKSRRILCSD